MTKKKINWEKPLTQNSGSQILTNDKIIKDLFHKNNEGTVKNK